MPDVTFVQPDGTSETVDIPVGMSVMEGAIRNDVRGIDAECGGACACATCHIYVDPGWVQKVALAGEIETAMLDLAVDPKENSRLSCQLTLTDALHGLIVHVPIAQS